MDNLSFLFFEDNVIDFIQSNLLGGLYYILVFLHLRFVIMLL